jgi:hypothetical protein
MNRLPRGSADEFLLANRPKRKKEKPMVSKSSNAPTGSKNSYQSVLLSPEQKKRFKDYKDRKGKVL